MIHPTANVSEEVNRKCRPTNRMVQLSTPPPHTDPECNNAQHHRQTDKRVWCYHVTVQSAKNWTVRQKMKVKLLPPLLFLANGIPHK